MDKINNELVGHIEHRGLKAIFNPCIPWVCSPSLSVLLFSPC